MRPLRPSRLLDVAATRHTRAMVRTGVISHRVPGEAPLRARVSVTGYFKRPGSIGAAEALAWVSDGQATPQGLLTVLLGSPAHRAILLSSRFRDVGAGLAWIGGPVAGPGAGSAIITLNLGHASS